MKTTTQIKVHIAREDMNTLYENFVRDGRVSIGDKSYSIELIRENGREKDDNGKNA